MLTSEVREVFAVLRPALTEIVASRARGRRVLPARRLPARAAARVRRAPHRLARVRRVVVAARPHRAPVLHVVLEPRRPAHDAVPARRPRVGLVVAPRGGARPLRARDRGRAAPLAARGRAVARRQRVAEPHLGEPRRPQPAVLGALVRSRSRRRSRASSDVELDAFVRAINRAEPGLIRVDADETTYSLHIILRFELEQELLEGTVALEDLPEVWNARMKEFLGVDVPDDAPRRPPGRPLVGRRVRLLPDVRARQRHLPPVLAGRPRGAARPRRPAGRGRPAAALGLAARQPLLARPEADAEGDDRAADRLARARPRRRTSRYLRDKKLRRRLDGRAGARPRTTGGDPRGRSRRSRTTSR